MSPQEEKCWKFFIRERAVVTGTRLQTWPFPGCNVGLGSYHREEKGGGDVTAGRKMLEVLHQRKSGCHGDKAADMAVSWLQCWFRKLPQGGKGWRGCHRKKKNAGSSSSEKERLSRGQ